MRHSRPGYQPPTGPPKPVPGRPPAPLPAPARPRRPDPARPLDCALVPTGLLIWQLVDFAYADIGGPSTVLTAVVFGLAAWWSLVGATEETRPTAETPVPVLTEGALIQ